MPIQQKNTTGFGEGISKANLVKLMLVEIGTFAMI